MDLYENKEECNIPNQEDDLSDSWQGVEQSNNQQEGRKSHTITEDQQQNNRRGRSETRKNSRRNRNITHPSMRRNQKEDNPLNDLNN